MILTTKVRTRIFQVSFVFLFLSIQSLLRESIKISFVEMVENLEDNIQRDMRAESEWDPSVLYRAQVVFSLFHVIMQIPAGVWAERYGAKIVMQVSMLYCASISLFTPFAIIIGGPISMMVLVSLQGLGQGCFIPSFYVFTSQWVPLSERSFIFSAAFGGGHFGSAVGIPIIEIFCRSRLGWWSGYVFSSLTGFFWVFCSIYIMKAWSRRERISTNTRAQYDSIFNTIEISEKGVTISVPWKRILSSIPFWSTMFDHFGSIWINGVFLQEFTYFVQVHKTKPGTFDMTLPYIVSFFMIIVFGMMVVMLEKLEFSRVARRRVMSSIALWGGSLLLFILSLGERSFAVAQSIFLLGAACSSSAYCGVFLNHAELSPFFAGTLMGISNVVGNSAHVIRPVVQNFIVTNQASKAQWRLNFLASSTVTFFSNLPFVLYGSSKEQTWSPKFVWIDEGLEEEESYHRRYHGRGIKSPKDLKTLDLPPSRSKSKSKKRLSKKKANTRSKTPVKASKKISRTSNKRWKK